MIQLPSATPAWPRSYWQPGHGKALLQFYVFGKFPSDLVIPAARYESQGLPPGVDLQRFQNAVLRHWEGYPLHGALGEVLRDENADVYAAARVAPEVLVIRGEINDQASLDYLSDTLGVIAALLDLGGASVLDPQILSLFEAQVWRQRYLVPGGAPPRAHVLIVCRADEGVDCMRVSTRGLRKFGRPDLDLRHVPAAHANQAGLLCQQLVELMMLGADFIDGQELAIEGMPSLVVERDGHEDPDFSNVHVSLRWPG